MQKTALRNSGFSLIELVIVMAVMGILAVIALPSYRDYVIRSNQADAQEFLLNVATSAQSYRLSNRLYPTALGDGAGELDITPDEALSKLYQVTLTTDNSTSPPSYELTAVPKAGSMMADEPSMTVFSDGRRLPEALWR